MAGISKVEKLNRQLACYRHFATEAEALSFAHGKKLKNYVLSSNQDGTCWTIYYKNLWKI